MINVEQSGRVNKTWGYEEILVNNEKYCGKLLHIEKNKYCSLHYHDIKDETFTVLNGQVKLEIVDDGEKGYTTLNRGESVRIKPRMAHRFTGIEDENILIEISTQHFDDDSYRLEPSYQE